MFRSSFVNNHFDSFMLIDDYYILGSTNFIITFYFYFLVTVKIIKCTHSNWLAYYYYNLFEEYLTLHFFENE